MFIKIFFILISFSILSSCGKKAENSDSSDAQDPNRRTTTNNNNNNDGNVNAQIPDQKLVCNDTWECPENIAKIVVVGANGNDFCTGVLIKNDEILTSASCLNKKLSSTNLECSSSVFAVFPKSILGSEEAIKCEQIKYSDHNSKLEHPALWHNDTAIIQLSKKTDRSVFAINKEGIKEDVYNVWKVTYESDKVGVLEKEKCRTIQKTYLNPFSNKDKSGMMVATDCELGESAVGAPLIKDNEVYGVFSQEMGENIYNYLESANVVVGDIGKYYHFSNLACSPYDPYFPPASLDPECTKEKTFNELDQLRSNFLINKEIHLAQMDRVEREIEKPSTYFLWEVQFQESITQQGVYELNVTRPRCIFDSKSWIWRFSRWGGRRIRTYAKVNVEMPNFIFKTKLNTRLIPISTYAEAETKEYQIEFNPFNAHVKKFTDVTISRMVAGEIQAEEYLEVTDQCE